MGWTGKLGSYLARLGNFVLGRLGDAALADADTALGADTAAAAIGLAGQTDSAAASEAESLALAGPDDVAAGADAVSAIALAGQSDTASGAEAEALALAAADADTAAGADAELLAAAVGDPDAGTGADEPSAIALVAADDEPGSGVFTEQVLVNLADGDSAAGSDGGEVISAPLRCPPEAWVVEVSTPWADLASVQAAAALLEPSYPPQAAVSPLAPEAELSPLGLVRAAIQNLMPNPSFESPPSAWGPFEVVLSQVLGDAVFGSACMEVAFNGVAPEGGAGAGLSGLVVGRAYTASAYVKRDAAPGQVELSVSNNTAALGGHDFPSGGGTPGGDWQRVSFTFVHADGLDGPGNATFYIWAYGTPQGTLRADGIQVQQGALTAYADADHPGFYPLVTPSAELARVGPPAAVLEPSPYSATLEVCP